jgi:hypothetical protein
MNRWAWHSMLGAWGGIVVFSARVEAQTPPPPAPGLAPAQGVGAGDLSSLVRQLGERVRQLGDTVAAEQGNSPSGATLLQDTRELAQAVEEYRKALPNAPDGLRRRQLFSGVDTSWHHLHARLSKPGVASAKLDAAAKPVTAIDTQIHQALGLNAYPPVYYGSTPSPGGMREIQRLARALVHRSEALLGAVRTDLAGPVGSRLSQEVTSLVQAADAYHDGITLDAHPDTLTRNGFAGVLAASDALAADFATVTLTDRVRAAWQSYKTTETLMRQALKLPVPQGDQNSSATAVNGQTPITELADRLVRQADEFLIVFTREARDVPEGGYFIADVRRLRGAAAAFRAEIPRAIEVGQLAFGFQDIDALWETLARRTNRIAGQEGPNVQRIEGIGQTVAEIHRLLGMPGVPAVVGPF